MKPFILFQFLLVFVLQGQGQVIEVNLLGKSVKLHGIDYRLSTASMAPHHSYFRLAHDAADFGFNNQFKERNLTNFRAFASPRIAPVNSQYVGVALRPFAFHPNQFIRLIEVNHGFEVARKYYDSRNTNEYNTFLRSTQIGYQLGGTISSPTLGENVRLYVQGNAAIFQDFGSKIFIDTENDFNTPVQGTIRRLGAPGEFRHTMSGRYKERMYSTALSLGWKYRLSCYWNVHFEARYLSQYSFIGTEKTFHQNDRWGLQLGLRYKLGGTPGEYSDEGNSDTKGPVFW